MPGSILGSGNRAGSSRGKLRQTPCNSGSSVVLGETVNKQVEKYPNRKRTDGDNKQDDTEPAWEREGGCCSLSGQGGPLGGGDPELRSNQEVASR